MGRMGRWVVACTGLAWACGASLGVTRVNRRRALACYAACEAIARPGAHTMTKTCILLFFAPLALACLSSALGACAS